MRRLAPLLLLAILSAGCAVHVRPAPLPRPVPAPPPPPPAPPAPAPVPEVISSTEVRAKEIHAGYVNARVIYAKEVKANGGRIGRIERWDDRWGDDDDDRGRGRGKGRGKGHGKREVEPRYGWGANELSAAEVHADTLYVKEVKADWIDADLIVAKEVKIGR